MNTKQDVLKACTVSGKVVKLPSVQLDRKLYQDVAKSLELIGGKWNRKEQGFIFHESPEQLLSTIANGTKVNLKKEYQFFATPDDIADRMVEMAGIEEYDLLLEPSAGQGAIIKAIHRKHPNHLVHYCELMELNRTFLSRLNNVQYITDNFLKLKHNKVTAMGIFDKIIANPPFSGNQDIDHINAMYECCKDGGRIVTIASNSWRWGSQKKQVKFREWLDSIDSVVEDLPAGTFKESGTNIATCLITIDK